MDQIINMKQFSGLDFQDQITGWENDENNDQYNKIYANRLHSIISDVVNVRKQTSSSKLLFRENIKNNLPSFNYTKFNDIVGLKNDKVILQQIRGEINNCHEIRQLFKAQTGILNQLKYHQNQADKSVGVKSNDQIIFNSKEVDLRMIKASSQVKGEYSLFEGERHIPRKKRNFFIKANTRNQLAFETKKFLNYLPKQIDKKQELKDHQSQKIQSFLNKRQGVKFPLFYREIQIQSKKVKIKIQKFKHKSSLNILQKKSKYGREFVDDKIFSTGVIRSDKQFLFC